MNEGKLILSMLVHPIDVFRIIKARKLKLNYLLLSAFLLLMLVVVRIAYVYIVHYPLSILNPRDTNLLLEVIRMLVPVITWIIACYGVTSIIDGESTLKETVAAAALAMLPYITFMLPLAFLSKIMEISNEGLFNATLKLVLIWVLILFFLGVKELNDYSFFKTVNICLLNIVTMLLIWAIIVMFLALTGQLLTFLNGLVMELKLLLS